MHPCTTKRRMTTNEKKNKQPELPENRTVWKSDNQKVKEETFIQISRRYGEDTQQGGGWKTKWSHICVQITGKNNWGARHIEQPRVLVRENIASKPLVIKTCRGCGGRRNSQPHKRVHWRHPQGPRMYTNPPTHPPRESAPEGPNLLVSSGGSA